MTAPTIDTSIAADERLAGDGAAAAPAKAPKSFAAAGDAFLASLKPEQHEQELAGPDDLEGGDSAEEGAGAETAAQSITRPEDGATWKPELGRWVDGAGRMVAGTAPEGAAPVATKPAALAPPAPKAASAPAPKAGEEAASAPETITLPGLSDRGEEDIEIEIDDPAVAERLRRMAKDGIRASAAREQRAALEADRARFAEVTAAVEDDPIGFVIGKMSPERQLEVARALILEHLDTLLPDIDELAATPGLRSDRRLDLQRTMSTAASEAAEVRNARAYAGRIVSSIEALVPEDTDPTDAREFVDSSRTYLAKLAQSGQRITPESVPTLLARHIRMLGSPAAIPRPASGTVAKPATDAARAVAARVSLEDADRSAQRVRRVQIQRAAATRVAPAGAGAAPVSVPLLKPEERTDIRTASKALLRPGVLPNTWTSS